MDESLEVFLSNGRYKDGLKKCEKLLKKNNPNVVYFVYKARLLSALGLRQEARAVLDTLVDRTPAITDTIVLKSIDDFYTQDEIDDHFPVQLSSGPTASKLWANCIAAMRQHAQYAFQDRWEGAVLDRRWQDAATSLASWRKAEPNRKDLKMMHIAVYQLIAQTTKDPMLARLNMQLAHKTLIQAKSQFDCEADVLLALDVLRRQGTADNTVNWICKNESPVIDLILKNYEAEVQAVELVCRNFPMVNDDLLTALITGWISKMLLPHESGHDTPSRQRARRDWRMFKAMTASPKGTWDAGIRELVLHGIANNEDDTTRFAFMVRMWLKQQYGSSDELLDQVCRYYDLFRPRPFCSSDLREYLLALPRSSQDLFRQHIHIKSGEYLQKLDSSEPDPEIGTFLSIEGNALMLDYLLTIGSHPGASVSVRQTFISNVVQVLRLSSRAGYSHTQDEDILIASACYAAYEVDRDPRHLLFAVSVLCSFLDETFDYQVSVLLIGICNELGLIALALSIFLRLGLKEIQLETAAHIGLTRVSILFPTDGILQNTLPGSIDTAKHLASVRHVCGTTNGRIAEQQQSLLAVGVNRPDLLLPLDDMRRCLHHSISGRMLALEYRRLHRLLNQPPQPGHREHPATIQMWTEDLEDHRDFDILGKYELEGPNIMKLERRLQSGGKIPDADWIRYHLWIDEVCCRVSGSYGALLAQPSFSATAPQAKSLTQEEAAFADYWQALAAVTFAVFPYDTNQKDAKPPAASDVEKAVAGLKSCLNDLPPPGIGLLDLNDVTIPRGRTVQAYFLLLDFLQSVGRFAFAAVEVNAGKRPGQKASGMKELFVSAHKSFDKVIEMARQMKGFIDQQTIEDALKERWDFYKWPGEQREIKLQAEHFATAARNTWDTVIALKFPTSAS